MPDFPRSEDERGEGGTEINRCVLESSAHLRLHTNVRLGKQLSPVAPSRRARIGSERTFQVRLCSDHQPLPFYASRNALVIGMRAARNAGNRPPTKPINTAKARPISSKPGVTLKAKASSLKELVPVAAV